MLPKVRRWLERPFAATPPPTPEQARGAAATARHDRAGTIDDLRTEVRRLQQDIKDVSDALDGLTDAERTAHERRLASLHGDLERKQQELGRLQAHV